MKQSRIVVSRSPENSSTKLPIFVRLYAPRIGDFLEYKEGSVPFFIRMFYTGGSSLYESFEDFYDAIFTQRRKLDRSFILSNFWVYNVSDYGSQSLSPGLSDFLPLCFDSNGLKIPQYRTAILKNYTSKETFILIPKEGELSEPQISIIIEFRDLVKSSQEFVLNRSQGGTFSLNFSDVDLNSIEDLSFFAEEDSDYFEIPSTEYGILVNQPTNGYTGSLVTEQATYFGKELKGSSPDKVYHDITVAISDNYRSLNTIYCRSRKNETDYYYISGASAQTLPVIGNTNSIDVYSENPTTKLLSKIIPGVDYYVGADRRIKLVGTPARMYEVFLKPNSDRELDLPFTASDTKRTFNDKEALYNKNAADWNYVSADKILFKNGTFQGYMGSNSSGYTGSFADGRYEYVLFNIVHTGYNGSSAPASDTNTVEFISSSQTFDSFNKYQSAMDPFLMGYGETPTTSRANRELEFYIQDKSRGFKFYSGSSAREPYIEYIGSNAKVLDLADPYPALLQSVNSYVGSRGVQGYTGYQGYVGSQGTQSEVVNLLRGSQAVQNIETNIQKTKRNLKAMAKNSGSSGYSNVSSSLVAERNPMFLVIKGTYSSGSNPRFNITYKSGGIAIKKEYACELDSDGYYVSIPFFMNELGGTTNIIDGFDIERFNSSDALTYRAFK
jgi:hypothetical protein